MSFSIRLQQAMDAANIKQTELCEKTGIGKSSISQYLSGLYEPKQKNIYLLAKALNVDPAFLMGIADKSSDQITDNKKHPSLPALTPKDEREIVKDLEAMINALDDRSGMAAYEDSEDEEDLELLKASLLTSMKLAKQIAKKKYTPKKHRKE